jgi:chromosomal replication initiation ATPase DnaA
MLYQPAFHDDRDAVAAQQGMRVVLSLFRGRMEVPAGRGLGARSRMMHTVASEVAAQSGFSVAELRGPGRTKELAAARQALMWRLRQLPFVSTPMIGRYLGGRDHTTILHGCIRHEERMRAEEAAFRGSALAVEADDPLRTRPSMVTVTRAIAGRRGFTVDEIQGPDGSDEIVAARAEVAWALCKRWSYETLEVAGFFGITSARVIRLVGRHALVREQCGSAAA